MKSSRFVLFIVMCLLLLFPLCKKLEKITYVLTGIVNKTTHNSTEITGIIVDIGNGALQYGHCFGKTNNVTVSDPKTELGIPDTGNFISVLTNLDPNTKYYAKAYITDGRSTFYGKEISFTTHSLSIPVLTTTTITAITTTTLSSGGNIESDGGYSVTSRGVCWDKSPGPTLADNKTMDGSGAGSYTSNLVGLLPSTTYYLRAYATNYLGTAYGNELNFSTAAADLPVVLTKEVTNLKLNSAESGGTILSDGGVPILSRGVCWSVDSNPTILNSSYTDEGSGAGSFVSNLSGLSSNTIYHVRAYATNYVGTAYGLDINFTTPSVSLPTVTTKSVSPISSTEASSGGNVTSDGGAIVNARGVCWKTNPNPTIDDNKTSNGTGLGLYISSLSNLTPNTNYYVRAYATNSMGTSYGEQVTFKTTESIVDVDGNLYNTVIIGSQVWLKENLMTKKLNDNTVISNITDNVEWSTLTTPGYCFYTNNETNYKNVYGALYNWNAVKTGLLCPTGWHVPIESELHTLILYLDANAVLSNIESSIAGGILKESGTTYWNYPNTGATNESGFSARPGGNRKATDGTYYLMNTYGYWWSQTESDGSHAWSRGMVLNSAQVIRGPADKRSGLSVRCIKD
jgi:uncharacterized protein (TIGR02145 family)